MSVAAWLARRLPFHYGWVVVGCAFVTIGIGANSRTAFSLLFPPLLDETGWSRGLTAGIFSFGFVLSIAVSAGVGWIMDRLGPCFVMPVAAWTVALGFLLATVATAPWQLYLTLGGMVVGASVGLAFIGHGAFVPHWFTHRRGLAMGIASSGVGVGSVALFPWMQWFVDTHGWRETCWVLALVMLAVLIPLNLLLPRRHPSDLGLRPEGAAALPRGGLPSGAPAPSDARVADPAWASRRWTVAAAVGTTRYWYMWGAYFSGLFAWYCVQVHQTRYLLDVGFSTDEAAWALTLVGVTGIVGLIGIGHMSDRIGREWSWTLASGGFVACYALLLLLEHAPHPALMYLMVVVQGGLGYGFAPIFGAVASDLFAGPRFGTIFGTLSLGAGLGAAAGPWVGGLLFDVTGSYAPAFLLAGGAAAASAAFVWLAAPRKVRPVGAA